MGNTKFIQWEGDIFKGSEEQFSEDKLLEIAHGDHVTVKVFPTYLHYEGRQKTENDLPFVLGHLTTHSMSGFEVVEHIKQYIKNGRIWWHDLDYPSSKWCLISDKVINVFDISQIEFEKRIYQFSKPKNA